MIPALIGAVVTVLVTILGLFAQSRGPKHDRELLRMDIELMKLLAEGEAKAGMRKAIANQAQRLAMKSDAYERLKSGVRILLIIFASLLTISFITYAVAAVGSTLERMLLFVVTVLSIPTIVLLGVLMVSAIQEAGQSHRAAKRAGMDERGLSAQKDEGQG